MCDLCVSVPEGLTGNTLLESLGFDPFFSGVVEGVLEELMLIEMVVVDEAGTDVFGEETASVLLAGKPLLSILLTGL